MLILTRKPGQALTIWPERNLDLSTPIETLFADGPIRVLVAGVSGPQVRLGVAADSRLTILRDELLASADTGPLPADVRAVFARKLRVLRFMRRHSAESLAACAGVSLSTVLGAERGAGVVDIDDLERLARALGGGDCGVVPRAGADGGGAGGDGGVAGVGIINRGEAPLLQTTCQVSGGGLGRPARRQRARTGSLGNRR